MVIGFNYSAFKSLFANADGMADGAEYIENTYSLKTLTEFIGEKPEFVSIVSFNVNDPDSGIFYGPEIPRTMGALSNIFLLIEYERQVADGELDPDDLVGLDEIEKYLLPQVNQNAHEGAMAFLTEDESAITNDEAMRAMVQFNSLAIADYFWFKLGEENIRALMDSLALSNTEMPIPFSGIYISLNREISLLVIEPYDENDLILTVDSSRSFNHELMLDVAFEYHMFEESSSKVKKYFEENRLNMSFIEERNSLKFFPQTTAADITDLLARLWRNEIISAEVSEAVKDKMSWAFNADGIQRSFTDYGAFYDARMGMLSGIDYGTSIYDDHTSVQAVFFDKLPVAFWLHMSANHMQEDYQQRLIWDPALFETTLEQIELHNE
jgi:hypothetical protein